LALLTTSHPLLAKTIEGTTSAYNSSKTFSPRFKSSAEYVESYLTPIGNTLGSMGRVTGVEGSVRWLLRKQKPTSDLEAGATNAPKRRKIAEASSESTTGIAASGQEHDPYSFTRDRRLSMSTIDTLPAYDDACSPAYSETLDGQSAEKGAHLASGPPVSRPAPWQNRLILSTSGLSVAMSEESLKSLKFCLKWLRWANGHIAKVITDLTAALEQYERDPSESSAPPTPEARTALAERIRSLRTDILNTLRNSIMTVSKYAGGALPENATNLVRAHLTSLPQRWEKACQGQPPETAGGASASGGEAPNDEAAKETQGAKRALVLAREGLDMMAQVSDVLNGTILSAEDWCDRLGRRRGPENPAESTAKPLPANETAARLPGMAEGAPKQLVANEAMRRVPGEDVQMQ
jgi:transcriptional repressor OPI1